MAAQKQYHTLSAASEFIEQAAESAEVANGVGDISAAHLRARAKAVFGALGGTDAQQLASAVSELVRDCVTLPEWVDHERESEDDDTFDWIFGAAVAEVIAASVAAIAGLSDCGVLPALGEDYVMEIAHVAEVLEEFGREIDCLAPYLFGSLCRAEAAGRSKTRLQLALQSVCAWTLAAIGRTLGYDRFNAHVLWQWADGDCLWVTVLVKGALALRVSSPLGRASLPVPSDLDDLQDAALRALLGLTDASVAFAKETWGCVVGETIAVTEDIDIATRSMQLLEHRERLSSAVLEAGMMPFLICGACERGFYADLARFLAAILPPPPCLCSANRPAGSAFCDELKELGEDIWASFLAAAISGPAPGFLTDCASIVLSLPCGIILAEQLVSFCLKAPEAQHVGTLTALIVFAANAGLSAQSSPCIESNFNDQLRLEVGAKLRTWNGPVFRDRLAPWIALCSPLLADAHANSADIRRIDLTHVIEPRVSNSTSAPTVPSSEGGLRQLLAGAPQELRCALDGKLLTDPVRTPDGYICERSTLAAALANNNDSCPFTQRPMNINECRRDPALRVQALQWMRSQRASQAVKQRKV